MRTCQNHMALVVPRDWLEKMITQWKKKLGCDDKKVKNHGAISLLTQSSIQYLSQENILFTNVFINFAYISYVSFNKVISYNIYSKYRSFNMLSWFYLLAQCMQIDKT